MPKLQMHLEIKPMSMLGMDPNENINKANDQENKIGSVEPISDVSDTSDRNEKQLQSSAAISTNERAKLKTIYRIGYSDNFACKNCKVRGDKFFMKVHTCRGAK